MTNGYFLVQIFVGFYIIYIINYFFPFAYLSYISKIYKLQDFFQNRGYKKQGLLNGFQETHKKRFVQSGDLKE